MSAFGKGTSVVRWIEGHSFFGRPRYEKRQTTCAQAAQLADYTLRISTCKVKAANTCVTPDIAVTWTGDACVCSTLAAYTSKYNACWADTPYSICNDLAQNSVLFASFSSGHCTTMKRSTPTPTPTPINTPTPSPPKPAASVVSSAAPPPAASSPKPDMVPTSSPPRVDPKSSDSPKVTDPPSRSTPLPNTKQPSPNPSPTSAAGQSSEAPKSSSREPSQTTPTSIPQPSFVGISIAPRISADTSVVAPTISAHSPLARWTGKGALLKGYCATPDYTIIDGPTAYWAPVVGCVGAKADCCPFDIPPSTLAVDIKAEATGSVTNGRGFPSALSPAQSTLTVCPDDYHSIGEGCCPDNFFPWSTAFGGQTPCYSTVQAAMTPPPISANADPNPDPAKATSAIVNVVYAMQYQLQPTLKGGLGTGAKIGIGAGAGVGAIIFGILIFLLAWKHKAHKRDKAALEEMSGMGSARQSVAASSAFGGVKSWQKNISSDVSSGLEPVQEPALPQVAVPPHAQYPSDWRPNQHRTVSPPIPMPHPGYYSRASLPSPPIPEISEVGSDSGYGGGNRSELHSGEYGIRRQEMYGGHGGYSEPQGGYGEWRHEGVAQQVRYYEAPAGRMTPKPQ